jgi:hypothetical protein
MYALGAARQMAFMGYTAADTLVGADEVSATERTLGRHETVRPCWEINVRDQRAGAM